MKKKKILFNILLGFILILSTHKVDALSTSVTVKADKSTVVVGNTVTFTATIKSDKNLFALEYDISYNSNLLQITSGNTSNTIPLEGIKAKTLTWKFKAKKSGTATVKVNARSSDGEVYSSKSGSKSVKIITQSELEASYSNNNYLSGLKVEEGTLSPAFNKTVTSYTVELPPNTEEINIKGSKADSKASVEGLGKVSVEDGTNIIKVVVTAQNGSSRTYTITANVKELDPIKVNINNEEYTVVRKSKLLTSPGTNFKESTTKINDVEVPTLYNENANITLVGLKNKDGNIKLYEYDNKNNSYIEYNQYTFKSLSLYIKDKEIENYKNKEDITINDRKVTMYKLENNNYLYFYAINLETGKESIYSFDKDEETVQKYLKSDTIVKETIKKDSKEELYKYIILGLLGFILLTYIILLLVLIFSKKKKSIVQVAETNEKQQELEDNNLDEEELEFTKDDLLSKKELKEKEEREKELEKTKEKLAKDTAEELKRINNTNTSDTNVLVDAIEEAISEETNKKTKKKTRKKKTRKENIDNMED